jgi:hypothetical protein
MRKKDQKIMRMKETVNVRLRGSQLLFSLAMCPALMAHVVLK